MNSHSRSRRFFLLAALAMLVMTSVVLVDRPASASLMTSLTVKGLNLQAQPSQTKSFVIMIGTNGFDDNASIVVNQGDTVKITFVLTPNQAADTSADNHHVIAIDGYNVQSADINPTHPNATVTFTADQLGTFSIYCDTPECPIHALMVSGTLEVDAPASTTTSSTSTTTTSSTSSATTTTSSSTTSTAMTSTPEFPSSVLGVLALIAVATVAILARRITPRPTGPVGP